jgi:D-beta-D-heptose 7-phosphate kinase/D-beta-D-heptose 1-phosphate adenosyltransferase
LTSDTAILTAVANDYGYEHLFSRQVRALATTGDIVIAMSTSGRSPNVLAGVREAASMGVPTIAMTGTPGAPLAELADLAVIVPSNDTALIQETHLTIGHIICEVAEARLLSARDALPTGDPSGFIALPEEGSKLLAWTELKCLRESWRADDQRVAWTNGCFDLLHAGHIRLLREARCLGDVLIVAVNSDRSVEALKGPGRPIATFAERAEMLSALEMVDWVVVLDDLTPTGALQELRPEVIVKGADYRPPLGDPMPEAEVVSSYGGKIHFVPLVKGLSTTTAAARLQFGRTSS